MREKRRREKSPFRNPPRELSSPPLCRNSREEGEMHDWNTVYPVYSLFSCAVKRFGSGTRPISPLPGNETLEFGKITPKAKAVS